MALKLNTTTPKPVTDLDMPSLSPKQVEAMTGGALTSGQLKTDRYEAEQNGTAPKLPYYRMGYRTVRYKPADVRFYLETLRVG
ncbi:hypothetical protein [Pseudophaeobacter flagellatus]|uniref:hypothetical protein n=1 Tax=Pseudophaeobacter flagellatus TaxID=2899119 RepID=UPI001E3F1FB2|nr:hypothetical protein [Pseudophaeobacter flagellatus]MCD9146726.1 hypothetical protein [Pseudophaeobacter flagellatus]